MSNKVMKSVWKADIPMAQKMVILKLADFAKDDGSDIFPSQKRVAKECGCSDRHVRNVIEWALGAGMLVEEPGPRNRPKTYAIDLGVLEGMTFQAEQDSGRNDIPASRNHVPPERNDVPTINKNYQLTTNEDTCRAKPDEPVEKEPVLEVIHFFNRTLDRKFQPGSREWSALRARMREGATVEVCKRVIRHKAKEWGEDPKMVKHLVPSTLFRPGHWDRYVEESGNDGVVANDDKYAGFKVMRHG